MGLVSGSKRVAPGVICLDTPWLTALTLTHGVEAPRFEGAEVTTAHIPALDGVLTWREDGVSHRSTLRVPDGLRPDEASTQLLRTWVDLACNVGSRTTEHVADIPLVTLSALDGVFDLTPLDELLARTGLGVLGRLARRPKSWLRREDEVVPLERVRRISRDAVRRLDRHAHEAWHDGERIYPGRILSTFVEEELDIYENRVLVHLMVALRDRAMLRQARIVRGLQQAQSLRDGLGQLYRLGQHRRLGRLKKRMNTAEVSLDGLITRAERAQAALARQTRSLIANLQTPVGRLLMHRAPARWPLKPTNILDFDTDYGQLPVLWRALEDERRRERAPDLVRDDVDATYADYCLVALLHALEEAGFTPHDASPVGLYAWGESGAHGSRWTRGDWRVGVEREGPMGEIRVTLHEDVPKPKPTKRRRGYHAPGSDTGASTAATEPLPGAVLRILPTFTVLRDHTVRPVARPGETAVWLHPIGEHDDRSTTWDEALERRSTCAVPGSDGASVNDLASQTLALPLAPWLYASIDRMGRLIRRVTLWQELQARRIPTTCPQCAGERRALGRDGDRTCVDSKCGLRWGIRTCACGVVIPKVLPKQASPETVRDLLASAKTPAARRAFLDVLCGREMLAEPSPHPDAIGRDFLICPGCGQCGEALCGSDPDCARCGG